VGGLKHKTYRTFHSLPEVAPMTQLSNYETEVWGSEQSLSHRLRYDLIFSEKNPQKMPSFGQSIIKCNKN